MIEDDNKNINISIVKSNNSVITRVSTKIETTSKILIQKTGLRDWWQGLDQFWADITFINIEFEKNKITVDEINKAQFRYEGNKSIINDTTHGAYEFIFKKRVITPDDLTSEDLERLYQLKNFKIFQYRDRFDPLSLSPISQLKSIVSLYCFQNNIKDLTPLRALTNLEELFIQDNSHLNINPLLELTKLKKLLLLFTCDNYKMIEKLVNLEELNINLSGVSSLNDFKNLENLKSLSFFGNDISDLEPLNKMTKMESLFCSMNNIASIKPIMHFNNLKILHCIKNNIPPEEIELFKQLHPDCEIAY